MIIFCTLALRLYYWVAALISIQWSWWCLQVSLPSESWPLVTSVVESRTHISIFYSFRSHSNTGQFVVRLWFWNKIWKWFKSQSWDLIYTNLWLEYIWFCSREYTNDDLIWFDMLLFCVILLSLITDHIPLPSQHIIFHLFGYTLALFTFLFRV